MLCRGLGKSWGGEGLIRLDSIMRVASSGPFNFLSIISDLVNDDLFC